MERIMILKTDKKKLTKLLMDKTQPAKSKIISVMALYLQKESMFTLDISNAFINTVAKELILLFIKKYGNQF